MIKANELRIGNWTKRSGTYVKVAFIYSDRPKLDPIPLSPSILEKSGFTSHADGHEYRIGLPLGQGTDLCIEVLGEDSGPYDVLITDRTADETPHCFSYLKQQRYLHQLQNLYYSLTGEELTINL